MLLTPAILKAATKSTQQRAELFAPLLSEACAHYEINTPARLSAFLAQIGHESLSLKYTQELWGPTPAQKRYEGRRDLGNTEPGDGYRYRGRGLIQTTGRYNYGVLRDRFRARGVDCPDFEVEPDTLSEPRWAAWSACDYWDWKNLNPIADSGNFTLITQKINGGQNGREDREDRWTHAKLAFPVNQQTVAVSTSATAPTVQQIEPTKEPEMALPALLLQALAPIFISKIPELVDIARTPTKDDRKEKGIEMAINVVTEALGASNAQEASERIESDPQAVEVARAAVRAQWFEIQEAEEKSRTLAREHAMTYSQMKDVRTVAGNFTFIEFLTLVFLVTCWVAIGILAAFNKITEGTLDNIIMLAAVASIVGIREFWYGSSFGSQKKDEERRQKEGV